jgi:hypothetical protein
MLLPNETVQFDAEAFDTFIKTHGVQFTLHKAMKCPVGMVDPDDIRKPHPHHANCVGGFLLNQVGTITCTFIANNKESHYLDPGRVDGSNATISLPRFYDEVCSGPPDQRVEVAVYDRLYFKDESMTVPTWQLTEAHITGHDRLLFPVVCVEYLVDSNGINYYQDKDFVIQNGQIVWTGTNRPGIDPKSQKGVVYSVRYRYRPYYYVKQILHEIRLIQKENEFTGERTVERMPMQVTAAREIFFEKEMKDAESPTPDSPRQHAGPAAGALFGPR